MKIADMHGDTIYEMLSRRRSGKEVFLKENDLHMDLQKMKKADYLLQNFALFVEMGECKNPYAEYFFPDNHLCLLCAFLTADKWYHCAYLLFS